jgi:hypothetical protein
MAVLQRVLYVEPSRPEVLAGNGSSWASPFGYGQLQNAIDAAAVYTYLRQRENRETRKAYVFVKGSYDSYYHTDIKARDGVSVFGGLPGNFNDTAYLNPDSNAFTNAECQRYINYVRAVSTGAASPNATPTNINSVHVVGDDFKTGFLLDGFVISNPVRKPDHSPIILDNELSAVRNCVIYGNKNETDPTADVRRGLLYNCLFYNDSADVIVRVGEHGLALNNTIVSDQADVIPLDDSEASEGAVQNTIAVYSNDPSSSCFAPYLTENTPYTLPAYLTNKPQLAYQLHEHSSLINAGNEVLPSLFDAYTADSTIAFRNDRDVLGNPRKIGSSVDIGALETWKVEKNQVQQITALTDKIGPLVAENLKRTGYIRNNGGNRYPHAGSVVYLMDSSAMTMQYKESGDFLLLTNSDSMTFSPGYVLLKPGASFYGNGHRVQFGYVAAEKRLINQRFSMTAFPFDYNAGNITVTEYDNATDSLNFKLSTLNFKTYQYSGAARSAKDYIFQTQNSSVWLPIDTLNRTAMDGYLMDFGSVMDTVLRFTAFAPASQAVYTENTKLKTVYLTQYDNRTAGTGADLDFTRQEDMGWNMKGLPWLVSNYRTDTILEDETYLRQMHIPHVLYQMDGAGNYYLHEGDRVYTTRSWDQGVTLAMGTAFLTQTATTQAREAVVFHLPYYDRNEKASRPMLRMSASRLRTDILQLFPDSSASKDVKYSYGRDGTKWIADQNAAQFYLMDSKRISRISLLGAAPIEVDIPLGVYAPETQDFTFDLPEKEAFANYGYVWLIDYAKSRYINLLEEDYETTIEQGEHNTRFAVRIGGFPKTDQSGKRQYVVFAADGMLYVRGLLAGDKIAVYTPSGQLVHQSIATGYEFTMPLYYQTGYVVRVNDSAHKVVNTL